MTTRLSRFAPYLAGAVAVSLTACSPSVSTDTTLTKRLANRGPVALSSDNPFIAGNLLLTREMAKSPELKGFIDHRGQPTALAVERDLLGSIQMTLFYDDRGERYELEQIDGMWLISNALPSGAGAASPLATSDRAAPITAPPAPAETVATNLPPAEPLQVAAPTLIGAERIPTTLGASPALPNVEIHTPLPAAPAPIPHDTVRAALQPGAFESPAANTADTSTALTASEPASRSSTAPLARLRALAAGHPAEATPRGDLVHHVTDERETLELIAEWYTAEVTNAPGLARINRRAPTAPLALGDTIVVPAYLIVNRNRLVEEAINELTGTRR